MKYLLSLCKVGQASPPGDKTRTIYRLDEEKYELVAVKEVKIQEQIQSYFDETNYKELLAKLRYDGEKEVIERYYPEGINTMYGDISMYADNYLDNHELAQDAIDYLNYLDKQKYDAKLKEIELLKKQELEKQELKKINENTGELL